MKLSHALLLVVALACAGCNGESSDIKDQYGKLDFSLMGDAGKLEAFMAPDFYLDTTLDPDKTFIFNGQGSFAQGDPKMAREEFKHRMWVAVNSGDHFHTDVGNVTVQGDHATADIVRSQTHAIMHVTYTATDEWKKTASGWQLAAEHLKQVDVK